jgi:hypothetical protein
MKTMWGARGLWGEKKKYKIKVGMLYFPEV